MSPKFDPNALLAAASKQKSEELASIDTDNQQLGGQIILFVRNAFDEAEKDDDTPIEQQIESAQMLKAKLEQGLSSLRGETNSPADLSADEQLLVKLFQDGKLVFVDQDNPDSPGQTLKVIRDTRWRRQPRRQQSPAPTPTSPTTPVPPPASPATPAPAPEPDPAPEPTTATQSSWIRKGLDKAKAAFS